MKILKCTIAIKCTMTHTHDVCICCTILLRTVLHCTILYYTILYCTRLYYTILYCTALYYTILYCTVLYYTILYCTVQHWNYIVCMMILYCALLHCKYSLRKDSSKYVNLISQNTTIRKEGRERRCRMIKAIKGKWIIHKNILRNNQKNILKKNVKKNVKKIYDTTGTYRR